MLKKENLIFTFLLTVCLVNVTNTHRYHKHGSHSKNNVMHKPKKNSGKISYGTKWTTRAHSPVLATVRAPDILRMRIPLRNSSSGSGKKQVQSVNPPKKLKAKVDANKSLKSKGQKALPKKQNKKKKSYGTKWTTTAHSPVIATIRAPDLIQQGHPLRTNSSSRKIIQKRVSLNKAVSLPVPAPVKVTSPVKVASPVKVHAPTRVSVPKSKFKFPSSMPNPKANKNKHARVNRKGMTWIRGKIRNKKMTEGKNKGKVVKYIEVTQGKKKLNKWMKKSLKKNKGKGKWVKAPGNKLMKRVKGNLIVNLGKGKGRGKRKGRGKGRGKGKHNKKNKGMKWIKAKVKTRRITSGKNKGKLVKWIQVNKEQDRAKLNKWMNKRLSKKNNLNVKSGNKGKLMNFRRSPRKNYEWTSR